MKAIIIITLSMIMTLLLTEKNISYNFIDDSIDHKKLACEVIKYSKLKNFTKNDSLKLEKYLKYNYKLCKMYNVDFATNLAKVYVESCFKENAVSRTGCVGLHQISKILCKTYDINFNDVKKDQYVNSEVGIRYFSSLIKKYPLSKALLSYENGVTGAESIFCNSNYDVKVTSKIPDFKKIIDESKL